MVGPAIAGVLLIFTSAQIAIWINAITFIISAFVLYLLPNIERKGETEQFQSLSFKVLKSDWGHVIQFSRENAYVVKVYFLAQFFFVIALGMDAQEVVFIMLIGFTGEIIPLRYSIIIASLLVLFASLLLIKMIYHPSRKVYYNEITF